MSSTSLAPPRPRPLPVTCLANERSASRAGPKDLALISYSTFLFFARWTTTTLSRVSPSTQSAMKVKPFCSL